MKQKREDVRNIAIIAHVDHGKTTLVDELLKQSGVFRENQEVAERVMDSNDIEKERGITILSKNTAITYKGTKINIIDTPGHADFGGEVERVLKMVNGVILVVDAFEGVMPQTKFVLMKALDLKLPVIVCVNKVDRPEARPNEVVDEVLELFMDLDASDEQLDCPFLFASARDGYAVREIHDLVNNKKDMTPLFETILDYIPAPEGDPEAPTQVLISTIDYNEYVGRIGVGKVDNGTIAVNQDMVVVNHHDPDKQKKVKISKLYEFDGLQKVEVKEASIGAIVAISGISDISIGDTLCSPENPTPIPFQKISEPTIAMNFMVNDSPFAGKEGEFVTSRHLRDRLMKELETRVMDIDVDDIRNKMEALGAIKVKSEDQVNEIYDFEDGRLLADKGYARVRTTIDRLTGKETVFMTTKKMLSQGTFKVMEENETIVEDGEMARKIFKSLGLVLQESISKYRESYKLNDSLIEIDINDKSFCPFPYLEIETSSEEKLEEILKLLGYTLADTTSKTIYEILAERGIEGKIKGR